MGKKFGSVDAYKQFLPQMVQNFAHEGIEFIPEGQRTGSSLHSHRIVTFAGQYEKQGDIMEELFRRYTTAQQWIGDVDICVAAAASVGLDEQEARRFMEDPSNGMREVQQDLKMGREMGVTGVPFFVINDQVGLSGAQVPDEFIKAFEHE